MILLRRYYTQKIVLFIVLFFVGNSLAEDSFSLAGKIINSSTGEPVPYTNVFIDSLGIGNLTDEAGYFSLLDIPDGIYDLTIYRIGYKKLICQISNCDQTKFHIWEMEPKNITMDSVSVIASREMRSHPMRFKVISSLAVREHPSIGEADVLRIVSDEAGVVAGNDYNLGLFIRGGNSDQTLISLDGIRIYNPYHLMGIFSTFDADILQGAALRKNVIHPEYGNALSGVLDTRLREGNHEKITFGTNISLLSGRARIEGPLPKNLGSFLVSYRHSWADLLVEGLGKSGLFPDKSVMDSILFPYHLADGVAKITIHPDKQSKISAFYYSGKDIWDIGAVDAMEAGGGRQNYYKNIVFWKNTAGSICYSRQLNPHTSIESVIGASKFLMHWEPEQMGSDSIFNEVSSIDIKTKLTWAPSRNLSFQTGFEILPTSYMFRITGLIYQPVYLPTTKTSEYSTFLWSEYKYKRFIFSGGFRLSNYDYQDTTAISPTIDISYKLQANWDLYGGLSRRNQGIMTLGNEEILMSIFNAWLPVPKEYQLLSSNQAIIGSRWYNENVDFQIESYYRYFDNLVEYNSRKYQSSDPDLASGYGKSYGLETSLHFKMGKNEIGIVYTLSKIKKTIAGVTYNARNDIPHDLVVTLGTPLGKSKWRGAARFHYHSGNPFTALIANTGHNSELYNLDGSFWEAMYNYNGIYSEKNAWRAPSYHRLDLRFSKPIIPRKPGKNLKYELYVDIINVYCRMNILAYPDGDISESLKQLPILISFGIRTII